MKGIVWLASYPKSGNTWFRTFLTNLLRNADKPANINHLDGGPIASARHPLDEALGYDTGDVALDEIDLLRPELYIEQAQKSKETMFCKVHDAYTLLPDGRPMFPSEATAGAFYFVRNPLDVCVSSAHHGGHGKFGRTIRHMADPDGFLCGSLDRQWDQLRQRTLGWSGHVRSWVDAPNLRIHVLRYEDMKQKPQETFTAAAKFADLPSDPERIAKAIEFSKFDEVRKQEETHGFNEKLAPAKQFFRKGETGSWRAELKPEQAAKIIADHGEIMRRFGYLDEAGNPVY